MSVAKVIQIVANSPTSFDDAVKQGISEASKTVKHITGAEVIKQTVDVENNNVTSYKVTLHVAFAVGD
jgi:hypothetical protein